jgi:ABC-type multidrug transport system fused ATPase/permease subunit
VFHPLLSILTGLGLLAVLWFGGQQVMAGEITRGEFVAFIFYLAMLTWPMIALGWVINLFQRGAASMGRINRIMTPSRRSPSPCDPISLPTARAPSSSATSGSATPARTAGCCATSPSASRRRDRRARRPDRLRASPPSSRCSRGATTRPRRQC